MIGTPVQRLRLLILIIAMGTAFAALRRGGAGSRAADVGEGASVSMVDPSLSAAGDGAPSEAPEKGPPEVIVRLEDGPTVGRGPSRIAVTNTAGEAVLNYSARIYSVLTDTGEVRSVPATVGEDGRIAVRRLPSSIQYIEVMGAGPSLSTHVGELESAMRGEAIVLGRGRSLTGRLADPAGPIAGAKIFARPILPLRARSAGRVTYVRPVRVSDGTTVLAASWTRNYEAGEGVFGEVHAQAASGEQGFFRLDGLSATRYRLTILLGEPFMGIASLDTEADATSEHVQLDIVSATVLVQDLGAHPVRGARVTLVDSEREQFLVGLMGAVTCDETGTATLRLMRGAGPFVVTPPSALGDLATVSVEGWSDGVNRVTLAPRRVIHGTVVDEHGNVVPYGLVQLRRHGGCDPWNVAMRCDDLGRFLLEDAPAGVLDAWATRESSIAVPFGAVSREHVWQIVDEGRSSAVVVVPRTEPLHLRWGGADAPVAAVFVCREPTESSGGEPFRTGLLGGGDTRAIEGLDPKARYTIWVDARDKGHAWATGVPSTGRLDLAPVAARRISGRILLPAGQRGDTWRVEVSAPPWSSDNAVINPEDGTFSYEWVPACQIRVHARVLCGGRWLSGEYNGIGATDIMFSVR